MTVPRGGIADGFRGIGVDISAHSKESFSDKLLKECLKKNASQLHLLPTRTGYRFYMRCGDELIECRVGGDVEYYLMLIEFKTKANIDINNKNRSHAGSFKVSLGSDMFQIKVNSVPTTIGNKKEALVIYVSVCCADNS